MIEEESKQANKQRDAQIVEEFEGDESSSDDAAESEEEREQY